MPDINSKIYQLFIDNLNGPEIKLDELLLDPIQKLLNEDLIKIEDEFNNSLKQFTNNYLNNLYGENDEIS